MRIPKRFLALFLSIVPAAFASDRDTSFSHYDVGIAVGMIGGSGLSVKRWIGPKDAIQINFAPYYLEEKYPGDGQDYYPTRDSGYSNSGFLSLGALYLHRIGDFNGLFFTSYGGGNYTAYYHKEDFYTTTYYGGSTDHQVRNTLRGNVALGGGLGVGIEFWRFEASALLGLEGAYDLDRKTRQLTPALDLGVHFKL
jgi:hypothetical protein